MTTTPPESHHKVMAYGPTGAGKTRFALSVLEYLRDVRQLKPEEVYFGFVDNDGGLDELLEGGLVDPDWIKCIDHVVCSNWKEVTENTARMLKKAKEYQAKYGKFNGWVVADNVGIAWNWTRDQYSLEVHGKYEEQHAADVRQELVQAGTPNKMAPTFDGRKEYPIITSMHARWADGIKLSGVNFVFLSPISSFKQDEESDEVVKAKGQKDNEYRVSHILKFYMEDEFGDTKYYVDLEKNRSFGRFFKRSPPTGKGLTYAQFRRWLDRNSPAALKAAEEAKKAAAPSPEVKA